MNGIEKITGRIAEDVGREIDELTAELDRELEWKPSDGAGTNMRQSDYAHLADCGKTMTDEEAKAFIADECGFAPEKIHILHEVNTYEVNKHRRLRKSATFDRAPVYESTDWNYVRFDCACFIIWKKSSAASKLPLSERREHEENYCLRLLQPDRRGQR